MSTEVAKQGIKGISSFLNSDGIKGKFTEIMGQKGIGFISSVLSVVNGNGQLQNADQNSIYTAALMAASLDLPINPNLGLAYIIPYNTKQANGTWKVMAQFQIGYKGFKQLAQRSGQFISLNESDVREGELISHDRLSGVIKFDWNQDTTDRLTKKIIGYVSFFELSNGFKSTLYMTSEEALAHGKKYSKTFQRYGTGLWKDEFDGMALKTVCKLNLSKNAPLSIEMQRAVLADQSVIKSYDPNADDVLVIDADYVDNDETTESKKKPKTKKEVDDKKADIKNKSAIKAETPKLDLP
jgi:recombination protein RecT